MQFLHAYNARKCRCSWREGSLIVARR
jgi:hypothetical protein